MYNIENLQTIEYHHSMLLDSNRMQAFLRAILWCVKKGDIVLDLGCGTGILSYFACIAGAKQVYAVEQGPIIELAERICRENGFQDRVTFIHDWSTNVHLPEKVNVIVTETIGNIGFEEGILAWVMDARERLLSEGGFIIPGAIELSIVPVECPNDYSRLDSWLGDIFSLDFSAARSVNANNLNWTQFSTGALISKPACVVRAELTNVSSEELCADKSFICERDGLVHGLGGWFTAELAPGERLSNAPPLEAESWSHVFLPLERPMAVNAGDRLEVRILAKNNAAHWEWEVTLDSIGNRKKLSSNDIGHYCQSTVSGDLQTPANGSYLNHNPELNEYGELDLFILQSMDGNTPVKEIAHRVVAKFPTKFTNEESALNYVYASVRDCGRWIKENRQEG